MGPKPNPSQPQAGPDRARALALVYQLLGAAHYFAVSQPTLGRIFGRDLLRATGEGFEDELRLLVRARLAATPGRLFC